MGGERPIDDRTAGINERNTLALRGLREAFGSDQNAGIAKLVVKSAHCLHRRLHLGRGLKALFAANTITRIVCLLVIVILAAIRFNAGERDFQRFACGQPEPSLLLCRRLPSFSGCASTGPEPSRSGPE